jgi:hypothetical protein
VTIRTVVEHGPKDKKVVAFAPDWPGWSRGANSADEALAMLEEYRVRYRPVASRARRGAEFDAAGKLRVVEEKVGTGSTDFWGISFSACALEVEPMSKVDLQRKLSLLKSSWALFDSVAARVSAELQKGPRGGGRERDHIIRHVIRVESEDFAKRVGLRIPENGALATAALAPYRTDFLAAMIEYNKGATKPMRSGNLPFLIRHSAYHTLDHAWEMQDKDLSSR